MTDNGGELEWASADSTMWHYAIARTPLDALIPEYAWLYRPQEQMRPTRSTCPPSLLAFAGDLPLRLLICFGFCGKETSGVWVCIPVDIEGGKRHRRTLQRSQQGDNGGCVVVVGAAVGGGRRPNLS